MGFGQSSHSIYGDVRFLLQPVSTHMCHVYRRRDAMETHVAVPPGRTRVEVVGLPASRGQQSGSWPFP